MASPDLSVASMVLIQCDGPAWWSLANLFQGHDPAVEIKVVF